MSDIRKALEKDIQAMALVWEKAVRDTHDFLSPAHFEIIKSQIPVYLASMPVYVWEESGEIKGFTGVDGDKVEMLFVSDRGKGIGRRLLEFAVEELGARRVDVNEQNSGAVGFYTHYGFRPTRRSESDASGMPYPIIHMELTQ